MLGKLIKYDLKALAKILAPLWGVLLVMGLIFGISIRSNLEGIGNTMIVFSLVVIVAVIVAIFVMNVIVVIQRFWKGLLQDEGYLMFTLPEVRRIWGNMASSAKVMGFPCNKINSPAATGIKVSSILILVCIDGYKYSLFVCLTLKDTLSVSQDNRTEVTILKGIARLFRLCKLGDPLG